MREEAGRRILISKVVAGSEEEREERKMWNSKNINFELNKNEL